MKTLMIVAAIACSAPAQAATVYSFEPEDTGFTRRALLSTTGPGIAHALVSGTYVGRVSGNLTSVSGPVTFNSGYFTALTTDGITVNVTGYSADEALLYSDSFVVNTTAPLFRTFDWQGVNRLQFGAPNGVAFMDNLTFGAPITSAVPEPTTWAMLLLGFGMTGAASRYRRRSTITTFA